MESSVVEAVTKLLDEHAGALATRAGAYEARGDRARNSVTKVRHYGRAWGLYHAAGLAVTLAGRLERESREA